MTKPHTPLMPRWPLVWAALLGIAAMAALLSQTFAATRSHAGSFLPVLALLTCLLASWYDAATGRVPNKLTYPAILLGLGLNLLGWLLAYAQLPQATAWLGATSAWDSLLGFALCAGIGLVCVLFGMGGGDMKLMVALGAMLGCYHAGVALLWALAVAVVFAVINLVLADRLNLTLQRIAVHLLSWIYLGQPPALDTAREDSQVGAKHVPLAVPLVIGLLLAQALPGVML